MIATKTVFGTAALVVAAAFALSPMALKAKPVSYQLPEETAKLEPGPNAETAQNNCTSCHSAEYITTQPQGPSFKKAFWQAEVTKMIKVYGAQIEDADAAKIVEYLSNTY